MKGRVELQHAPGKAGARLRVRRELAELEAVGPISSSAGRRRLALKAQLRLCRWLRLGGAGRRRQDRRSRCRRHRAVIVDDDVAIVSLAEDDLGDVVRRGGRRGRGAAVARGRYRRLRRRASLDSAAGADGGLLMVDIVLSLAVALLVEADQVALEVQLGLERLAT